MFSFESTGQPKFAYFERRSNGKYNGYAVGKHWMDATIAMWREDIDSGLLNRQELYDDPNIPNWFLDKIDI